MERLGIFNNRLGLTWYAFTWTVVDKNENKATNPYTDLHV